MVTPILRQLLPEKHTRSQKAYNEQNEDQFVSHGLSFLERDRVTRS